MSQARAHFGSRGGVDDYDPVAGPYEDEEDEEPADAFYPPPPAPEDLPVYDVPPLSYEDYDIHEQPYDEHDQPYEGHSQPYGGHSQSYGGHSQSYDDYSQSYERHKQSYDMHHHSYEVHHQSYEVHDQSYEVHDQPYEGGHRQPYHVQDAMYDIHHQQQQQGHEGHEMQEMAYGGRADGGAAMAPMHDHRHHRMAEQQHNQPRRGVAGGGRGGPIVVVGGGLPPQPHRPAPLQPTTHNGMTSAPTATSDSVPTTSMAPPRSPLKPALGHIDFWPSCQTRALRASDSTFETFDILVERANRWMQQFTDFELICCETVDKKVKLVQDIYSASMYYRDPDNQTPPACHIKGFRLWYRQRCIKSSTPIVLNFMDFMPRYLNPGEKHPRFETLSEVLEKANERIKQFPIQGSVISVETVVLKIPAAEWSGQLRINPRICQSFDEYFTHQITFLRIFYKVLDEYTYECIGVKDFPPDTIAEGGLFSPAQYSPLSSLIERARTWINQSRGIRICTLQTLETKHRKKSEGTRFNTEQMFEYKIEDRFRAYFLRVGYVKPADTSVCLASYPPPDVAHRTFVPYFKGEAYENITELLERSNACINCTGTCANPIYAESIPIPEWMIRWEFCEKGDRTFFDGEWYFLSDKDGNQKGPYRHPLVYAIRVYFDGDFQDPPFMRTEAMQPPSKSCCRVM